MSSIATQHRNDNHALGQGSAFLGAECLWVWQQPPRVTRPPNLNSVDQQHELITRRPYQLGPMPRRQVTTWRQALATVISATQEMPIAASSVSCPFCQRSNRVGPTISTPGPASNKGSATSRLAARKTNNQQAKSAA